MLARISGLNVRCMQATSDGRESTFLSDLQMSVQNQRSGAESVIGEVGALMRKIECDIWQVEVCRVGCTSDAGLMAATELMRHLSDDAATSPNCNGESWHSNIKEHAK